MRRLSQNSLRFYFTLSPKKNSMNYSIVPASWLIYRKPHCHVESIHLLKSFFPLRSRCIPMRVSCGRSPVSHQCLSRLGFASHPRQRQIFILGNLITLFWAAVMNFNAGLVICRDLANIFTCIVIWRTAPSGAGPEWWSSPAEHSLSNEMLRMAPGLCEP